jgi:hypothetical protein
MESHLVAQAGLIFLGLGLQMCIITPGFLDSLEVEKGQLEISNFRGCRGQKHSLWFPGIVSWSSEIKKRKV